MKHYEIRMHIKPTNIKYGGFQQSYNKFLDCTFVKADNFEAETWRGRQGLNRYIRVGRNPINENYLRAYQRRTEQRQAAETLYRQITGQRRGTPRYGT